MKGVASPQRHSSSQPRMGGGASAEGQRGGAEALTGCFAGTCALWNGVEALGAQAASPREGHSLQRLNGPLGPYN